MKSKLCLSAAAVIAMIAGMSTNTVFASYNSKYFIDVNEDSYAWAADAVDSLCEQDVVKGVGDNKFAPGSEIKRGDFVVLVNNTFDLKPFNTYSVGFSDVNTDDYYYTAIINAKGNGIIEDQYAFYPQQPITRGAAMGMLYRALDQAGYVKAISTDLSMYSDGNEVLDVRSQIALATLTQMGIISGSDGKIKYADTMSRAEMAMVFYKTIEYMDENEPAEIDRDPYVKNDKTSKTDKTKDTEKDTETDTDNEEKKGSASVLKDETSKETVVIDGTEIKGISGCTIRLSGSAENSVSVEKSASADIEDSVIHATGQSANGVAVNGKSSADISDCEIYAGNSAATGVRVYANAKASVSGGSIEAKGKKASAVKADGTATVSGTELIVNTGSAVTAQDAAEVKLDGCTITAESINEGLFRSVVGSEDVTTDKATITVKNCDITGDRKTVLFFANNNNLKAKLENCNIKRVAKLVDSSSDIAEKGKEGSVIEIDLVNQTLEADVICDSKSRVIINLKDGSHLITSVNEINLADYVEINVEEGSTLELTTDCYIDVLTYKDAIDIVENGRTIYYDGDLPENDWLFDDDYSLAYGGRLSPQ